MTVVAYRAYNAVNGLSAVQTSTIPVYERMWSFMDSAEPSVFVPTNDAGVDRVTF